MAHYKTIFLGSETSETETHELQLYANNKNNIYISIDMKSTQDSFICLDKATAIKLSKSLKTEISKIESEENNG